MVVIITNIVQAGSPCKQNPACLRNIEVDFQRQKSTFALETISRARFNAVRGLPAESNYSPGQNKRRLKNRLGYLCAAPLK